MAAKSIDLNCDMGESFGAYKIGSDAEVMPFITSANIACGWHAGDPVVMNRTVKLAGAARVGCGAHPGYPDLLGFGRRYMAVHPDELKCYFMYQVGALGAICRAHSVALRHVKPHGCLYLRAAEDPQTARAVIEAVAEVNPDLIYVTLAGRKGDAAARMAREYGLRVAREGFPDRAYTAEGTLVPRSHPGAVIADSEQVLARAVAMAAYGRVEAITGETIALQVDTLCIHGDHRHAVETVRQIRTAFAHAAVAIEPMLSGSEDRPS